MAAIQPQVYFGRKPINPASVQANRRLGEHERMVSTIGKAIKDALSAKGATQGWLAERIGVSDNAVSKWIRDGRISRENLALVVQVLDMDGGQVLAASHIAPVRDDSHGAPYKHGGISLSGNSIYIDRNTHSRLTQDGTVSVPVISLSRRRDGSSTLSDATVIDELKLSSAWLQRNLPHVTRPSNLALASSYGDSMSPTFADGDLLLIDRGVTEYQAPAVYVVDVGGDLDIKRVQRLPDRSLLLKPDNSLYDAVTIDCAAVKFMGRVVWAWAGRRL